MRKVLLVLAVVLLSVSCSKDDAEVVEKVKTLNGTIWEGTNDTFNYKLTYYKDEAIIVGTSRVIDRSYSTSYTYNYTHPKVVMSPFASDMAIMIGEINEGKMTLSNSSSDKAIVVLIKKE